MIQRLLQPMAQFPRGAVFATPTGSTERVDSHAVALHQTQGTRNRKHCVCMSTAMLKTLMNEPQKGTAPSSSGRSVLMTYLRASVHEVAIEASEQ